MTDSLRSAGYSSRVPPGRRTKPAGGPGAAAAHAAQRPGNQVRALGLLPRPARQPSMIDRCLRARTAVVRAADPIRAHASRSREPSPERNPVAALMTLAVPRAGWEPSDAAWKARAFVNIRGGARMDTKSFGRISGAAFRELSAGDLPHVAEALVRKLDRADGSLSIRDALADQVVRVLVNPCVTLHKRGQWIVGLLRGLDYETRVCSFIEFVACELVIGRSTQGDKVLRSGVYVDFGALLDGMAALAEGAGGVQVPMGRLESLLAGLARATRADRAEEGTGRAFAPQYQALALAALCEALGGPGMPAALRQAVLAFLCEPAHALAPCVRAALAYHFGVATSLWDSPIELQREVLSAVGGTPGLSPASVGAMTWGIGMHLLGKDPDDADWECDGDLVTESLVPADRLMAAVTRLAGDLPATCRRRLAEGLDWARQARSAADKATGREATLALAMLAATAQSATSAESPESTESAEPSSLDRADTAPLPPGLKVAFREGGR